ncbi:hypothetical protein DL98DRAFT_130454 [Cadophora sp. DSE1049]|nr:hypothetical protein DL98DRAFT_130454 [Cadophora sp. DSE1049]
MIYELVVIFPHPLKVYSLKTRPRRSLRMIVRHGELSPHKPLDLLRVNNQVYNEASEICYSKNIFVFGLGDNRSSSKLLDIEGMIAFTLKVRTGLIALVKSVNIEILDFEHHQNPDRCQCRARKGKESVYLLQAAILLVTCFKGLQSLKINDSGEVIMFDSEFAREHFIVQNLLLAELSEFYEILSFTCKWMQRRASQCWILHRP